MGIIQKRISLNKSLIKKLSKDYIFNSKLLILASVCITLTKYNNSTEISINVDDDFLKFDDKNRQKSVFDYICSLNHALENKSFSCISFNDFENKRITLSVFDNSLKIEFDSN